MKFQGNFIKRSFLASALLLGLAGSIALPASTVASRLPSGRVVFDRAPELVEASVLEVGAGVEPQVRLVVDLPANQGEPLEALVIRVREPDASVIFDTSATVAYTGKFAAEYARVPLANVGGISMDPHEVLVVFATPVEPGNRVAVVLTNKNSQITGLYEFGVTAYPAGDSPVGQFLGYESIEF